MKGPLVCYITLSNARAHYSYTIEGNAQNIIDIGTATLEYQGRNHCYCTLYLLIKEIVHLEFLGG